MIRTWPTLTLLGASLAFAAGPSAAVTLFDPGLATLPAVQGWSTTGFGTFTQSLVGGVYQLDTSAADFVAAGSARLAPTLLDTATGFTLDFSLGVVSERHAADDQRAGFSVIVTGADPRQSLEIGFWQDEVFAYTAGFVPGVATPFDTTASTAYSLVVADNRYSLLGDGTPLLAGSLVDYTGRGIPPYTTAGVIFFGDDTTRAQSVSRLGVVTLNVAAVPEASSSMLLGLGLAGLAGLAWRRSAPRRR